jgi:transposase
MINQRRPYKTYTREFKQEAVRLMETTDHPASEIAMEQGIRHEYFIHEFEAVIARLKLRRVSRVEPHQTDAI